MITCFERTNLHFVTYLTFSYRSRSQRNFFFISDRIMNKIKKIKNNFRFEWVHRIRQTSSPSLPESRNPSFAQSQQAFLIWCQAFPAFPRKLREKKLHKKTTHCTKPIIHCAKHQFLKGVSTDCFIKSCQKDVNRLLLEEHPLSVECIVQMTATMPKRRISKRMLCNTIAKKTQVVCLCVKNANNVLGRGGSACSMFSMQQGRIKFCKGCQIYNLYASLRSFSSADLA